MEPGRQHTAERPLAVRIEAYARFLAAQGVFREDESGAFHLNPRAALLHTAVDPVDRGGYPTTRPRRMTRRGSASVRTSARGSVS